MKNTFVGILVIILISIGGLFAEPVNLGMATKVANMKVTIKGKIDYTVDKVFELKDDDGTILSYVFNLQPKGYIAISTDTDITPVIAYSFRNNFVAEDIPQNIGYQMLKRDMQLRLEAIFQTSEGIKNKNNLFWEKYEKENMNFFKSKGRGIWPPQGTTITGGWVETQWNQGNPYDMFCPDDPQHGGKCATGCVATAMAQIVNYHRYIDNANFYDIDDYWSNYTTPHIHIDDDWQTYNFLSFPDLNGYLDQIREYYLTNWELTNELKAALSFACGVSLQMQYSADGSGTQESQIQTALLNKFGYDSANHYYEYQSTFYTTLQNNMMNALPASLGISAGGSAGHSIVCDGLNTDDDPYTYHLNFGWGGSSDGWYTLPDGMPAGFNEVSNGVMNIQGGVLPYLEINNTYLTELSGDGDGVINPGESATLRIQISNRQSFATATNIVGILRCSNPYVTILDSMGTWNDIPPGSCQGNLSDPFTVEFTDGIGARSVDFTLHLTSNPSPSFWADLPFDVGVSLNQAGWPFEVTNGVLGGPALVDMDGNGDIDVIFADMNGNVHYCNKSGEEFPGFPFDTGNQIWGSPAIADINGDGQLDIVVGSRSNKLFVIKSTGDTLFTYNTSSNILGTPAIADIDNNGSNEIIFGTTDRKLYVVNSSGTDYPNFPITLPSSMYPCIGAAVADINGDSLDEIIAGLRDDKVYCINKDGGILWSPLTSGEIHSAPTIVEINDIYKILVGTASGTLAIISSEGVIENEIPLDGDIKTSPVVVNLSGVPVSGFDDLTIIVGSTSGHLHIVDWDGNALSSSWPFSAGSPIESTPIVADIDNDDIFDIAFGSNNDNLYALNANALAPINFPVDCGYDVKSPPAIADIDGDGDYEIAVGTSDGLWVIDYKETYNPNTDVWPMYRYNLERTGCVDSIPTYNVSVEDNMTQYKYFIGQNFPNPAKNITTISFNLATDLHGLARIKIYNIKGQIVKTFRITNPESRTPNIVWDGTDKNGKRLSNGIYLYRLETDKYKSEIKKMVLLR